MNGDRLDELRRQATLREYTFTSDAPGIGGLVTRLRAAWNDVATKWQARPVIEQQSAFNRALVGWLERPAGMAELDERLIDHDRQQTRMNGRIATVTARAQRFPGAPNGRLRIAYFSPMPPSRSGIADYSAELLPHLARLADVTVFADDSPEQEIGLPLRPPGEYPSRRRDFDLPLYQMGNSDRHETLYDMMLRFPGVVVLHDYFLHHFIRHHTAGRGDWFSYGREMAYTLGSDGRRQGQAVRDERAAAPLFETPLNQRLIDSALGLIVHSRFAAERARDQRPNLPLAIIPALVETRTGRSLRQRLDAADDVVIFGSFGQITTEKQIEEALRAFQQVRESYPNALYLLVGEARPDVDLPSLVAEPGLGEAVRHVGYVADLGEFVDWIHTADVVVNLRHPTVGETSAIALRAMAAARPLIVYDQGWYSELPEDATLKVAPGDAIGLRGAMERLAESDDLRRSLGEAGHHYVREYCSPPQVARAYLDFLYTVLEPAKTAHA